MANVQSIADVPGIRVGHFTDTRNLTGCSVVLCSAGAEAAVDVRGGAPGTRETDLLGPGRLVHQIHAVLLTGGSAFGLAAADGVMRYLAEQGVGFAVGAARVPIVPAANLLDLGIGSASAYPDSQAGYQACLAARSGVLEEGCVGAGTGCTVGKSFGMPHAVKSGIGSAALRLADGVIVGALIAVNALGDVVNPVSGRIVAGARDPSTGEYVSAIARILRGPAPTEPATSGGNTTLGVVATDAQLSRDDLVRVAALAHDGLARVIRPAHTVFDGDTIFALATGESSVTPNPTAVAVAAGEVVATAIVRAVMAATAMGGLPAAGGQK